MTQMPQSPEQLAARLHGAVERRGLLAGELQAATADLRYAATELAEKIGLAGMVGTLGIPLSEIYKWLGAEPVFPTPENEDDSPANLLYEAWVLIANGGYWDHTDEQNKAAWDEARTVWRDKWHKTLPDMTGQYTVEWSGTTPQGEPIKVINEGEA